MDAFFSRRRFLRTSFGLGAGSVLSSLWPAIGEAGRLKLGNIGLILNVVKEDLKQDYVQTLKRLKIMGYQEVEFGGVLGPSARETRRVLDDLGLKAVAGGTAMRELSQSLDAMIETSQVLGRQYLVCYWPWMDGGQNKTLDDYKATAEQFNRLGEKCKAAGLRFAFHNHDKEFAPTQGRIPYDIFLEETDPNLVAMELDLYWITKGGQDPVAYFRKYPGRFELCHVKDMDATAERSFANVGKGIIDFKRIFAHAGQAGLKHFIVEHDRPSDPWQCAQDGYQYLSGL